MGILEKIHRLNPEQSQVLYSALVDDQLIEIRQYQNYRWMHIGGDSVQSLVDIDKPSQILLPNLQAMLAAFLLCEKPTRLLNLGFGGGTFERYFSIRLPEIEITSVESSQEVIRLAEEYFFIPEQSQVINDTAEHYLAHEQGLCDIILCDIFSAECHPPCLYDNKFYEDAFRCLQDSGVLVINLLPLSEKELVEILLPIRNHFEWVLLFETPNHANIILFALSNEPASVLVLEKRASKLAEKMNIDLTDMPNQLHILPRKST